MQQFHSTYVIILFCRLVKFESTKSLASTSSRSLGGALSDTADRETALHNVLTFIAEQQKYVQSNRDGPTRPCSVNEITKEFNIEGPPQELNDIKNSGSDYSLSKSSDNENYVTLKQLCEEFGLKREKEDEDKNKDEKDNTKAEKITVKVESNETDNMKVETNCVLNEQNNMLSEIENTKLKNNSNEEHNISTERDKLKAFNLEADIQKNIAYAEEVCLVTPLDVESENCSNMSVHPVDICSVNVEINNSFYQNSELDGDEKTDCDNLVMTNSDLTKSSDTSYSDVSTANCTSESLTSSVSTPDTVASKIPRRKTPSRIPISPARIAAANNHSNINNKENNRVQETKIPKSKIPHKNIKSKLKVSVFYNIMYTDRI